MQLDLQWQLGLFFPLETSFLSDEAAEYRSLTGSLLYISACTRPDVSFAVSFLSRFVTEPEHQHWIAAKRILRYLKGTVQHGLVFSGSKNVPNILQDYSDSDWGNDFNRRSTSGYVFTMNGGGSELEISATADICTFNSGSRVHGALSGI